MSREQWRGLVALGVVLAILGFSHHCAYTSGWDAHAEWSVEQQLAQACRLTAQQQGWSCDAGQEPPDARLWNAFVEICCTRAHTWSSE